MIRLFRKIRHKLLSENNYGIYILYAAGEIVLVMVGILLALQIDNWNEDRKQEITELQFLNRLVSDLANDSTYYNRLISNSETVIQDHKEFIYQVYQEQKNIKEVQDLFRLVRWNSEHLTTQNSTYIELSNSGNLNIIMKEEIKELIIDYYRENERAATHISEFNEVSTRHLIDVGKVVRNYFRLHPVTEDLYENIELSFEGEWEFINDPKSEQFRTLEHAISVYKIKHDQFLVHFISLKDMSIQLIGNIQNELGSRD